MKPTIRRTAPITGYFPSFFNELFQDDEWSHGPRSFVPGVNVKESDISYELSILAPGMSKEAFNISLEENTLVISAEVKHEETKTSEKYTRKEFSIHSFKRSFRLPENSVIVEQINAKYEDGILMVTLPKQLEPATTLSKRIVVS